MPAKTKIPAIESVDQLHTTIDEIARLEVALRAKEARRDKAIQIVRDEHDGPIEETKKRIKSLVGLAETYCLARRSEVFTSRNKSAATALARYGFREGNPSLCLLNRKWTWEMVLNGLKAAGLGRFVRSKEEVDKEALKTSTLTDGELAGIGLRLDQTERFYIEPKSEEAERITADPSLN